MYIATYHHTLVARDGNTGELRQVRELPATGGILALVETPDSSVAELEEMPAPASGGGHLIGTGPLAGCEFVSSADRTTFALRRNGFFAGAELANDAILFDREIAREWELFRFVSPDEGRRLLIPIQTANAFAQKVQALQDEGKPICLHFGCGPRRIEGYLNIDKFHAQAYSDDYFNFDFAERAWPIPDACVDYIYSEDFIEHIPQRNQLAFLAESFRVLKPGGFNRVNTPCLRQSMTHSDFNKGFSGFYFDEFDLWGHASLFTQTSLQEVAQTIGYRAAYFTGKSRGTSPYAVVDYRPGGDRDEVLGNIYADLMK